MAAQILMDGKGLLADIVYNQLSENYSLKRQSILEEVSRRNRISSSASRCLASIGLSKSGKKIEVLKVSRGFEVLFHLERESLVHSYDLIHLGCSCCADMRRIIAGPDRQEMWEFQERMAEGEGVLRDAWVTRFGTISNGNFDKE